MSEQKSQSDKLYLPCKKGRKLDFEFMETLITAVQKLVIKDVVQHSDRRITAAKQAIDSRV